MRLRVIKVRVRFCILGKVYLATIKKLDFNELSNRHLRFNRICAILIFVQSNRQIQVPHKLNENAQNVLKTTKSTEKLLKMGRNQHYLGRCANYNALRL